MQYKPPKAFFRIIVREESLNGTITFLLGFSDCFARAAITFPSEDRDLFIAAPCFSVSPVAPVLAARSLKPG